MRLAVVGATLGLVGALTLVGATLGNDDEAPFESVADRPALPLGSPTPGYAGAEESALDLATQFDAVEIAPGQPCPDEDLQVSWDDPGTDYETGAHYAPVGPRPSGNESANGIVSCQGSTYDYAGFSIDWDAGRWSADLAPDFGHEEPPAADHDDADDPDDPVDPDAPVDPDDPVGSGVPAPSGPTDLVDRLGDTLDEVGGLNGLELPEVWQGLFDDFPIEDLPPYDPQTTCSPRPKAGTYGFSTLVLDAFDSTGTSGIGRGCDVGGRSEHKEGRAWDWSALVTDADDAAAASQVIGWLLASDEHGNEYAMARRLGLMYVIYNHSIWRAYAPEAGWVGYTGPNPHTDHVHFSFSRAGGAGDTSFWQVAELPDVSALDFGPYALLPDAGGVSRTPDQPAVINAPTRPRPHRPNLPSRPGGPLVPGGGGGGGGGGGTPAPAPVVPPVIPPPPRPSLPVPVPTLPSLPTGGGGGGGGGGLPNCPPGTPVLPLPVDCLLPGRSR